MPEQPTPPRFDEPQDPQPTATQRVAKAINVVEMLPASWRPYVIPVLVLGAYEGAQVAAPYLGIATHTQIEHLEDDITALQSSIDELAEAVRQAHASPAE